MELQELVEAIYDEVDREIQEQNEKIEEWVKMILYTYATPRITGKITKGKLKWRGIKMTQIYSSFGERCITYEITQRGKLLGKLIQPLEITETPLLV